MSVEANKARQVREMFGRIAPRYDLLNHLLSINIDKRWRRFTVAQLADLLARSDARALDVCCGTADLAIELNRHAHTCGVDFCHNMLVIGNEKVARQARPIWLLEGDALQLPFANEAFNVITCAFGLRNLADPAAGLAEFFRILKPGGRVAILEFSQPVLPLFRTIFNFYFRYLLPLIGGAVSGSFTAYRYLPTSVAQFPNQEGLVAIMQATGYKKVRYFNLTGGIAALHLGERM
ncbi:MAG: bifunctional demethylmenaquinone methyltransferase/2-methoxy-6-polyprenyl-1,4-benzoquinol methylase UbiE [Acidobacteriota bacterium]